MKLFPWAWILQLVIVYSSSSCTHSMLILSQGVMSNQQKDTKKIMMNSQSACSRPTCTSTHPAAIWQL
jgi:hypothetical protein